MRAAFASPGHYAICRRHAISLFCLCLPPPYYCLLPLPFARFLHRLHDDAIVFISVIISLRLAPYATTPDTTEYRRFTPLLRH